MDSHAENLLVIANFTAAGSSKKNQQLTQGFLEFAQSRTRHCELVSSESHNLDDAITRCAVACDSVVAIGGDGTLNHAINRLPRDIKLGIIPAGTGNDFARNLNLGTNQREVFETALAGRPRKADTGVCNGRKFINGVGLGLDARVVFDMQHQRLPMLTGHAAYYAHALKQLLFAADENFQYLADEDSRQRDLLLLTIANGTTFGGGFRLVPEAKIDDGKLSVCEVGAFARLSRVLNFYRLSLGTHAELPEVRMYDVEHMEILGGPGVHAHLDGDWIGHPPFQIKISPGSLLVRESVAAA